MGVLSICPFTLLPAAATEARAAVVVGANTWQLSELEAGRVNTPYATVGSATRRSGFAWADLQRGQKLVWALVMCPPDEDIAQACTPWGVYAMPGLEASLAHDRQHLSCDTQLCWPDRTADDSHVDPWMRTAVTAGPGAAASPPARPPA